MKALAFFILTLPLLLSAQEQPATFNVPAIKAVNCDKSIAAKYASRLAFLLKKGKGMSIGAANPDYLITGTIEFSEVKGNDKAATKYITEEQKTGRYELNLAVKNKKTGKTEMTFNEVEPTAAKLQLTAPKIADAIIKKYQRIIKPSPKVVEPEKKQPPVQEIKPEPKPVKTEAKPAKKPVEAAQKPTENSPSVFRMDSLALYTLGTAGFGSYNDFNKYGVGGGMALQLTAYNLFVTPSIDFSMAKPGLSSIDSTRFLQGKLSLGFAIINTPSFALIPYVGGGMVWHTVNGVRDGESGTYNYYNPLAAVSLSAEFSLGENLRLILSPGYTIFFEQSSVDMFAGFEAGIRILF